MAGRGLFRVNSEPPGGSVVEYLASTCVDCLREHTTANYMVINTDGDETLYPSQILIGNRIRHNSVWSRAPYPLPGDKETDVCAWTSVFYLALALISIKEIRQLTSTDGMYNFYIIIPRVSHNIIIRWRKHCHSLQRLYINVILK